MNQKSRPRRRWKFAIRRQAESVALDVTRPRLRRRGQNMPTKSDKSRSWSTMPASRGGNGLLGATEAVIKGLGRHHRDQPHRRLQCDACVSGTLARYKRAFIVRHRSNSVVRALRTPSRRPTPPRSTGVLGFTSARRRARKAASARSCDRSGFHRNAAERKSARSNPELARTFIDHTPLGRAGKPEDSWAPRFFWFVGSVAYVTGSIVMRMAATGRFERGQRG